MERDRRSLKLLIAGAAREAKGTRTRGEGSAIEELAERLIIRAIERRASDLHIEPLTSYTRLRYRLDGRLFEDEEHIPRELTPFLTARLKVMARMDSAKRHLPQDGRIGYVYEGRRVDIRVASLPLVTGEKLVLRLMNTEGKGLSLAELGFGEKNLRLFSALISRPSGLVICAGPMGSGKTTTLYAALDALNKPGVNILSLEDPVERRITGINQVEINEAMGLGYLEGLKAALRQDAQKILLGEIRDSETAAMALRIALTGHLLLTTLHTESSVAAIYRLLEMGVQPYLLAATLTGVVAQRLVRRLCPHCREKYQAEKGSPEEELLGEGAALCRAKGCEKCAGTGFYGRLALQEVLVIDEELRQLILNRADKTRLKERALASGLVTLGEDGLQKVRAGLTTLEEVRLAVGEL